MVTSHWLKDGPRRVGHGVAHVADLDALRGAEGFGVEVIAKVRRADERVVSADIGVIRFTGKPWTRAFALVDVPPVAAQTAGRGSGQLDPDGGACAKDGGPGHVPAADELLEQPRRSGLRAAKQPLAASYRQLEGIVQPKLLGNIGLGQTLNLSQRQAGLRMCVHLPALGELAVHGSYVVQQLAGGVVRQKGEPTSEAIFDVDVAGMVIRGSAGRAERPDVAVEEVVDEQRTETELAGVPGRVLAYLTLPKVTVMVRSGQRGAGQGCRAVIADARSSQPSAPCSPGTALIPLPPTERHPGHSPPLCQPQVSEASRRTQLRPAASGMRRRTTRAAGGVPSVAKSAPKLPPPSLAAPRQLLSKPSCFSGLSGDPDTARLRPSASLEPPNSGGPDSVIPTQVAKKRMRQQPQADAHGSRRIPHRDPDARASGPVDCGRLLSRELRTRLSPASRSIIRL